MRRRRENRRINAGRPTAERRHALLAVAAFMVVDFLALVVWGVGRVSDPGAIPIRGVHIEGEFRQLKPAEISTLVANELRGGFFTVGIAEIQSGLRNNPWIDEVEVRRVWPDRIELTIVERRALARWGPAALLSAQGVVFSPPPESLPEGLVRLEGPAGSEAQVLARLQDLRPRLEPVGAVLARLSLSPRRSWSFALQDGLEVVVGRGDFDARVERFLAYYERLRAGSEGALERVDLRYTNGFAVRRRLPAPTARTSTRGAGEKV